MSEIRIAYKAFAKYLTEDDPHGVSEVVVDWAGADELSDLEVCEAAFHQTNVYNGELWDLVEPELSATRTHTALSVGDEVTVRGATYRCENIGWAAVTSDELI